MKVICGDMEFGEFVVAEGRSKLCIVHKVHAVFDHLSMSFDFDSLLQHPYNYDSYVIPEAVNYEIVYVPGAFDAITQRGPSK